jgi:sphingomyelin phosphodiesterase
MPKDAPGYIDRLFKQASFGKRDRFKRETITFVHFSDAHLDTQYEEGATADCGLAYCCRTESETGKGTVKAGKWGAPPNSSNSCDIPQITLDSVFDKIN